MLSKSSPSTISSNNNNNMHSVLPKIQNQSEFLIYDNTKQIHSDSFESMHNNVTNLDEIEDEQCGGIHQV